MESSKRRYAGCAGKKSNYKIGWAKKQDFLRFRGIEIFKKYLTLFCLLNERDIRIRIAKVYGFSSQEHTITISGKSGKHRDIIEDENNETNYPCDYIFFFHRDFTKRVACASW